MFISTTRTTIATSTTIDQCFRDMGVSHKYLSMRISHTYTLRSFAIPSCKGFSTVSEANPELERLRDVEGLPAWRRWGPYLSDRQWGTVREDYSPTGDPWAYFPFAHAHRRAYRWGEDGLAGISDEGQRLCLARRALERPRSDPQGTSVRPGQRRREPRRGRQGTLLPPRCHADALVFEDALQVSAGAVPVRASCARRTAAAAGTTRNSSFSTPASSTTTATSTCSWNTPSPARATSSCASPRTTAARTPRNCTSCPLSGIATPGAGTPKKCVPRSSRPTHAHALAPRMGRVPFRL